MTDLKSQAADLLKELTERGGDSLDFELPVDAHPVRLTTFLGAVTDALREKCDEPHWHAATLILEKACDLDMETTMIAAAPFARLRPTQMTGIVFRKRFIDRVFPWIKHWCGARERRNRLEKLEREVEDATGFLDNLSPEEKERLARLGRELDRKYGKSDS